MCLVRGERHTNLVCCGRSTTWQLGRPAARSWRTTTAGHTAARTTTAWLICSAHDRRPPSFTLSRGVEIPPRDRLLIIRYGARTCTFVVPSRHADRPGARAPRPPRNRGRRRRAGKYENKLKKTFSLRQPVNGRRSCSVIGRARKLFFFFYFSFFLLLFFFFF